MSISYRKRRDSFTRVFTTDFLKIIPAVIPWDELQFNSAHLQSKSYEKNVVQHIILMRFLNTKFQVVNGWNWLKLSHNIAGLSPYHKAFVYNIPSAMIQRRNKSFKGIVC